MSCENFLRIVLCKHVQAGQKPDVYFGNREFTEYAVCFDCADVINDCPPEASGVLVDAICGHCAVALGIPPTLPGPLGWYDRNLQLQQSADDEAAA